MRVPTEHMNCTNYKSVLLQCSKRLALKNYFRKTDSVLTVYLQRRFGEGHDHKLYQQKARYKKKSFPKIRPEGV